MTEKPKSKPKEHKITITDEVWKEMRIQAALEGTSATALCEYVLSHYVDLPAEQKPPNRSFSGPSKKRSVYLLRNTWAKLVECSIDEDLSLIHISEPTRPY